MPEPNIITQNLGDRRMTLKSHQFANPYGRSTTFHKQPFKDKKRDILTLHLLKASEENIRLPVKLGKCVSYQACQFP